MAQRTVDLYNLNLGDHAPHQFSGAQYVGPISIQIVPDYDEVAKHLPRGELDGQPERKGSWVVTARATFDDTAPPGILALPGVPNEGGIWDLCRLLTFITGSWVVTDPEALPRRNQNPASSRLCWPSKTFEVAATAWAHREQLKADKLSIPLLLFNEALGLNLYEATAALHFAALDVIETQAVEKWLASICSKDAWDDAKERTAAALEGCSLPPEMRELAQEGLDGLWKGGAIVAKEKLLHLLLDLDIVAPSADFKRVRRQLASVLQVRNKLTHTGELPRLLDGYAAKDGRSVAHVIMSSIVPAIVQMALGRALGIWGGGRDEYCQSPATLREFFERGTYLGENPSKAVVFPLAT